MIFSEPSSPSASQHPRELVCPFCGQQHEPVSLRRGEKALCRQCDAVLATHSQDGRDAALAFTLTGLILALPAMLLPFVTAGKIGRVHSSMLFSGASALWDEGMRVLGVWVLVCGFLAPVLLLGTLAGLLLPLPRGFPLTLKPWLGRVGHALEHWAMPEVHVLAVLIALIKLSTLVNVTIGPGFWCYSAMSFLTLLAWRSYDLGTATSRLAAAPSDPASRA